jgi:hypothetical protein
LAGQSDMDKRIHVAASAKETDTGLGIITE